MAVRLDVTVQEEIDAAVETIHAEGRGLYGLVNNAGVATFGPLTQTPDSGLHFVFNVNVAGVLRTTRAFAPMILESQGRIVTTGSISGSVGARRVLWAPVHSNSMTDIRETGRSFSNNGVVPVRRYDVLPATGRSPLPGIARMTGSYVAGRSASAQNSTETLVEPAVFCGLRSVRRR